MVGQHREGGIVVLVCKTMAQLSIEETVQAYLDNDTRNYRDLHRSPDPYDSHLQHLLVVHCAQHLFWAESLGNSAFVEQAKETLENVLHDLGLGLTPP